MFKNDTKLMESAIALAEELHFTRGSQIAHQPADADKEHPGCGGAYGAFEYDAASDTFRLADLIDKPPQGNDAT
ncbi:hypothetical protein [Acidisarcina polymorpha]|uniref:hypothetical protein n=1 Tax=Acidisarcina polymorpha TaxID=2211140 RepID=UPI00191BE057|nr:hypothetical protein [Acidisarcina polymorpha]